MTRKWLFYFLGFVILAIVLIVAALISKRILIKNHLLTTGTVNKVDWGGSRMPKYIIEYSFFADNSQYNSTIQLECGSTELGKLRAMLIGLKLPVIYNPTIPSINTLLLKKKTFDMYKIKPPDSLKALSIFESCQ